MASGGPHGTAGWCTDHPRDLAAATAAAATQHRCNAQGAERDKRDLVARGAVQRLEGLAQLALDEPPVAASPTRWNGF